MDNEEAGKVTSFENGGVADADALIFVSKIACVAGCDRPQNAVGRFQHSLDGVIPSLQRRGRCAESAAGVVAHKSRFGVSDHPGAPSLGCALSGLRFAS